MKNSLIIMGLNSRQKNSDIHLIFILTNNEAKNKKINHMDNTKYHLDSIKPPLAAITSGSNFLYVYIVAEFWPILLSSVASIH